MKIHFQHFQKYLSLEYRHHEEPIQWCLPRTYTYGGFGRSRI